MTYEYEQLFGWHRILIEGDPGYRETLIKNSPKAFSAVAAICETHTKVHFSKLLMLFIYLSTYHSVT